MSQTLEQLLGVAPLSRANHQRTMRLSFLFFSDVREDISDRQKYDFASELVLFGDHEGFEAIYFPERHFHVFGSIYANPAIMAAYLIPQTRRIRFRTAGVSLPLHHPAEVVEWWAMNDVLSGGRVDLGFGSGWAAGDFILAPTHYSDRRSICSNNIEVVRRLWRGEAVSFEGPERRMSDVVCYPRPIQPELSVWLLVTQNNEGFIHAGRMGYNIFTMLYGNNLEVMAEKIRLYREAREMAGHDPATGRVTLTLHTLILEDTEQVERAVRVPFKAYIRTALDAHLDARAREQGTAPPTEEERGKILDYSYERYFKTSAMFGTVDDGYCRVQEALAAGVDEIACLVDFGVDQEIVRQSLPHLARLKSRL